MANLPVPGLIWTPAIQELLSTYCLIIRVNDPEVSEASLDTFIALQMNAPVTQVRFYRSLHDATVRALFRVFGVPAQGQMNAVVEQQQIVVAGEAVHEQENQIVVADRGRGRERRGRRGGGRRRYPPWQDDEDELLAQAVAHNTHNAVISWDSVAAMVPNRDKTRCKSRWRSLNRHVGGHDGN